MFLQQIQVLGLSCEITTSEGIIVNFFGYSNQEKIDNPTKNIVSLMSPQAVLILAHKLLKKNL